MNSYIRDNPPPYTLLHVYIYRYTHVTFSKHRGVRHPLQTQNTVTMALITCTHHISISYPLSFFYLDIQSGYIFKLHLSLCMMCVHDVYIIRCLPNVYEDIYRVQACIYFQIKIQLDKNY